MSTQLIDFSTTKDDNSLNTHMKSIQLNEQDHLDLLYLNKKQCDTVQECTNDDLKTEIQQLFHTNNYGIFIEDIFDKSQNCESQFSYLQNDKEKTVIQTQQHNDNNNNQDQTDNNTELWQQSVQLNQLNKQQNIVTYKNIQSLGQKEQSEKNDTPTFKMLEKQIKKAQNPQKLIKSINLLVNVKSFYRQITRNTRVLGKLTKYQHYLINDVTSIFQAHQSSKRLQFFQYFPKLKKCLQLSNRAICCLFQIIPMFEPYNLYKFLWDIFQAVLILSVMFLFSLITFFQMSPQNYIEFFQVVFVLFVLDILFTFNTGVVEKGNVIFDRKKAALVYLKKNFIMDQIALLPLFMFFLNIELEGLYSWAIYFQILMKLFVLSDIFDRLTFYLNYQKDMKNIVDLVKLVFIIACVCHVFCLFWHGLAIYEIKKGFEKTWLQVREIENADVFTRYVQSFYYLAVTMITVGYGDITPQTTYEILLTTITMFVTGFFYAFSLNRIGSIIENIELKDKSYKESMQIIHRLMREENVSQTLRVQISNYLQYLYKESNEVGKQQEKEIIDKLSKQLKNGLIQDVQGKYLKEVEFIDKLETKPKIVEIMEECLFSPGEYIFQQGDLDDSALYYIVKGSVKITYEYFDDNQIQSLVITQLSKSQYFGDMQFIQGSARILTAQASEFCRTYKIPRDEFFKCIRQSEQDFENFQMLKEAYIFKENQKLFNIKCYTCNKTDHISIKCPKTHLTLSKSTLIQKESKTAPHLERKNVKRRYQKNNSLSLNFETIDAVFQILERDEHLLALQQLEDQIHLSCDEAFLDQQLLEQEGFEQTATLTPQEQNRILVTNERIVEVDQEEEQEISQNVHYSLKNIYQDVDKSPQSLNKLKNQVMKNKQKELTHENISSFNCLNDFSKKPFFGDEQQQIYSKEKNSSLTSVSQKPYVKSKQIISPKNQNEENQSQETLTVNMNQISSQSFNSYTQDRKSQNLINEEIKSKKILSSQKKPNSEDHQINQSNQGSYDFNEKNYKSKQEVGTSQICTNKSQMDNSFIRKKFYSLFDLDRHINSFNQSLEEQEYLVGENQQKKQNISNEQNQKINSQLNGSKLQMQRSQSFDEDSSKRLKQILKEQALLNSKRKSQNEFKSNLSQLQQIANSKQLQEEKIQTNNSSNSNFDLSKQNINLTSQSTIKSISSSQNHSKYEQSTNPISKQQQLKRRQSQQINLIRQMQQQNRRISQIVLQENQQNFGQNIPLKNYQNQQYQIQQSLTLNMSNRRQSINQNQIQNILNYNNQNQNSFSQISPQLINSPLIAKRRSNGFVKNFYKPQQQETYLSKNSNLIAIESIENSKLLPEKLRNNSSLIFENNGKEHLRKQFQSLGKFEMHSQSNQNNNITSLQSNLQLQNNAFSSQQQPELQMQLADSNYLMLQIFDKAINYKYYYPKWNINIVVKKLKHNKPRLKKQKSLRKQNSRIINQNKKSIKQPNQNL